MVNNYVLGFVFSKEKVLLIKKAKPDWQSGLLNGVGGKIDQGETSFHAMEREFCEETGITIIENNWEFCIEMIVPNLDSRVCIFRSSLSFKQLYGVDLKPSDNPEEVLCVCDISDPENNFLGCKIIPNLRWIIPMLRDAGLRRSISITYHQSLKENK